MSSPSARGVVAAVMLVTVFFFAAACGSRTGDYGLAGGEGGDDGCLDIGQACSTSAECCDATCENGFCGGTCTPDGASCDVDADCCNESCSDGICGGEECVPVNGSCGMTAECCDDAQCLGGICIPGQCLGDGSFCNEPEECCSAVCEDGICGFQECTPDGGACFDGFECCSGSCLGGVCGSPGCTHGECDAGPPLGRFCSPCTELICDLEPFCCDVQWDPFCVELVENECGLPCSTCTANGGFCSSDPDCCSQNCDAGICSPPCLPDGAGCNFSGECCSGQCNGGFCGPGGDCSHDECTVGAPLDAGCTPCVAQVCAADPFCCNNMWDGLCVDEAEQFCGLNCGMCAPDGQFCQGPAECCSGICNNNVCGQPCVPDGGFCNAPFECCSGVCNGNVCGLQCVPDGGFCNLPDECCSGECNNNVCGAGGDCSHDECTLGGPLLDTCTPCTAQVCGIDPFCCTTSWDSICVDEAEQFCGLNCGCTPDGQMCVDPDECCSGSCNNGVCGPPCQPDGTFCFDADQCCGGACNNFQCGGCLPDGFPCGDPGECCNGQCNGGFCGSGPVCPSDGSACGDCVADNCCGELVSCLTSPGCAQDLFCFQNCTSGGGGFLQCFFQCVDDPAAFDVIGCLAGNCAGACL